jgi:hypothetical protein
MATEMRGKYTIVSRPDYVADKAIWVSHATVFWSDEKNFHYHRFQNPNAKSQIFPTETEAELFGLLIARAWIENKL